jgi:predicted DNA-binding transcriptional regulator YafY
MEIIPHVLKLGSDAELIAPKKARQLIAQQLSKMTATYS